MPENQLIQAKDDSDNAKNKPKPLPEIFGSFHIVLKDDEMNKPKDDKPPAEQPERRD